METIRILIADQQPLFCCGIRSTLESRENYSVVGETQDIGTLLTLVSLATSDVALIDARILNSTMEIVQHLRTLAPRLALIVLTPSANEEEFFQALRAGAAAYLVRSVALATLVEVVERVSAGEYLFSGDLLPSPSAAGPHRASLSGKAVMSPRLGDPDPEEEACLLSVRERGILGMVAGGNSNKAIARSLGISDQTVKNHITAILRKLKANDRTQAVMLGVQRGLVQLEPVAVTHQTGGNTARKKRTLSRTSPN